MTFDESLKHLGIEDFRERILNSNSHGELFHLADYITLAGCFRAGATSFRPWFLSTVNRAEQNWKRPESCFQHMIQLLQADFEDLKLNKQKRE